MTFFESLLLLLFVAVALLQVARRVALPYPAMLAVAGVALAYIPGAPTFRLDGQTTLALFIAPVLLDAGYDFPAVTARRLWRPLVVLAGGAVLATAAAVACIGHWGAGLPVAAALVLGAIVAPPDAAAAVAVLRSLSLPRVTVTILKGESLFNDAVALLLFSGALVVQQAGALDVATALRLALAVPGGVLLGVAAGWLMGRVSRLVVNTLGGNLLQFLNVYLIWVVADHLHLSAVLAVVAAAMTVARGPGGGGSARMRSHSLAVWASVVFVLNVLAFMLMGMQARTILADMPPGRLVRVAELAGLIIVAILLTRMAYVLVWNRLTVRFAARLGLDRPPTLGQGLVVGWCGMRGLVTLATAFALPVDFPQRDLVELTAYGVVLATLVLQGVTLAPLIRRLGLDGIDDPAAGLADARLRLATVASGAVRASACGGTSDMTLGEMYRLKSTRPPPDGAGERLLAFRQMSLALVAAQRRELARLRDVEDLDVDAFYALQEELDWRELTLLPEPERRIEEF